DRDLRPDDAAAHRLHALENPARPFRHRRRNCEPRRFLRLGRLLVHDRRGIRYFRRTGDLLSESIDAVTPLLTTRTARGEEGSGAGANLVSVAFSRPGECRYRAIRRPS